jgi:hypothetical protein
MGNDVLGRDGWEDQSWFGRYTFYQVYYRIHEQDVDGQVHESRVEYHEKHWQLGKVAREDVVV